MTVKVSGYRIKTLIGNILGDNSGKNTTEGPES